MEPEIYHERQRLQFCLLHALNNLLQGHHRFTRQSLDAIADALEHQRSTVFFIRHHRNILTGNYDANVLLAALAGLNIHPIWHDRRKPLDLTGLTGVIANITTRSLLGLYKNRHWLALRSIHNRWFNLDSELHRPVELQDVAAFLDYLLLDRGAELFFITDFGEREKKNGEKTMGFD